MGGEGDLPDRLCGLGEAGTGSGAVEQLVVEPRLTQD